MRSLTTGLSAAPAATASVPRSAIRPELLPATRSPQLPAIAVVLTEHRLHHLRCPDCGTVTRALLPADVPAGAFGPRLSAALATLAVRNRISRRDTVELAGELFGVRISAGSVDANLRRTAKALERPCEELLDRTRASRYSTSMRPAGAPGAPGAPSGARSPGARRSFASPPTVTSAR